MDSVFKALSDPTRRKILELLTEKDMAAYEAYLAGKLKDYSYPQEKIDEALQNLPKVE